MTESDANPITDEEVSSPVNEEVTNPFSTKKDEEIIQKLQEQLARSQADYANLVRRSREESAQISQWIEDKTLLKFLPILDNLERSLEHIPAEFSNHVWVE